jgi:hypothetical protein
MSLRNDVLLCLASERRAAFLAALAHELTVSARGSYVQVGNAPEAASSGLRCHNELLHGVAGQLWASLAHSTGYPDDVFIDDLISKAEVFGGCGGGLRWALEQALRTTASVSEPSADAVPMSAASVELDERAS